MAVKENGESPKFLSSKPSGYGEAETFRREYMGSGEKNAAGGIFPHSHKLTTRKIRKGGARIGKVHKKTPSGHKIPKEADCLIPV